MHLKGLSVRKNKAMYFATVNIVYSENSFVYILLTMKENEKDDSFSPLLIGTEYYQLYFCLIDLSVSFFFPTFVFLYWL